MFAKLYHKAQCLLLGHAMGHWLDVTHVTARVPIRFMRQCTRCGLVQYGHRATSYHISKV